MNMHRSGLLLSSLLLAGGQRAACALSPLGPTGLRSGVLHASSLHSSAPRGGGGACPPARPDHPALVLPALGAATVASVYAASSAYLTVAGVPDADSSARYLVCDATDIGYRMSDFYRGQDVALTGAQLDTMREYLWQRARREPVQYIIGNWDFYGLTLDCVAPVLIPRPETEELVEHVVAAIRENHQHQHQRRGDGARVDSSPALRVLDVGCGTGAIGLALLTEFPHAHCTAVDLSEDAVALARRNAAAVLGPNHAARYTVHHMPFLDYVAAVRDSALPGDFDVVVSNPPYIPSEEMPGLQSEVQGYEDERALHGGSDGLDVVRELLQHAPALFRAETEIEARAQAQTQAPVLVPVPVRRGGRRLPRELWLEVSEKHPAAVCTLLGPSGAAEPALKSRYSRVEGLEDLAGKPRFIRLTLSPDTPAPS